MYKITELSILSENESCIKKAQQKILIELFQVHEAMQKMHERKNVGKIILDPSLEPKPRPATPAKGKDKKKQNSEEKKAEEEKKEEPLTNGESAGDSGMWSAALNE